MHFQVSLVLYLNRVQFEAFISHVQCCLIFVGRRCQCFVGTLAMAFGDEKVEGSVASLVLGSSISSQNGDPLSTEDLAWVDSCLVKDPEIPGGDWNSITDALIEILSQQGSHKSTVPETNSFLDGNDMEMVPPGEVGSSNFVESVEGIEHESIPAIEETGTRSDGSTIENGTSVLFSQLLLEPLSETSVKDPFLPNYKDESAAANDSEDSELDAGLTTNEEPSTEDIFRVWDLGIPEEEAELIKQLKKALAGSEAWEDLKEESVDSLVSGISDLSLY
ncbi:hypothetical protein K2173_013511 [Erythroxylum novogranatense]|uniref:Uncharacterized protein n=1 Tax=Erythroxylum novogranatense TaxID=1862640 RepID=A0AAV8TMF7_9ROSI|nr:hypothetical protein K2173_013511 [Erythroxylum novogranatense]